MTGYNLRSHQDRFGKGSEESTSAANQLKQQYIPGDILWTKMNCSWWPAQVVDETSIRGKPKRKFRDDILIRLYGSYEYLYVNPRKCRMEFENILKQENISIKEVFQNSLEKDLSQLTSGGNSRRKVSGTRGNTSAKAPISKRHDEEVIEGHQNPVVSSPVSSSKPKRARKEEKEMDDARDKPQVVKEVEQDEAKKSSVTSSKRTSGIKALNQDTLRRSQHNKVKELVTVSDGSNYIEEDEVKHSRKRASEIKTLNQDTLRQSQCNEDMEQVTVSDRLNRLEEDQTEHCRYGSDDPMLKVNNGDPNTKGERKHGSVQMKQEDEEHMKEEVINEALKRKSVKKGDVRSADSGASKLEHRKQYPRRNHKHKDLEQAREKVTNERSKGRGKRNVEIGIPNKVERGVIGDPKGKRGKQKGLTEAEYKDAEEARQMVINELLKHKIINRGESERQNATKETTNNASRSQSADQDASGQRKDESAQKHQSSQSPASTRYNMPDENGDSSVRKTRVMQSLGLIAPSGSPFHRSGKL